MSLEAISGWLGPNLCPQWSTPRKWPIRTSQSFAFNSGTKCAITPLSTVWRSMTLNDGNGNDLWNASGNRLPQVSSPMKVMFFCRDFSWEIMLSSVIFELAKFLPASTKVGRLPGKLVKDWYDVHVKYTWMMLEIHVHVNLIMQACTCTCTRLYFGWASAEHCIGGLVGASEKRGLLAREYIILLQCTVHTCPLLKLFTQSPAYPGYPLHFTNPRWKINTKSIHASLVHHQLQTNTVDKNNIEFTEGVVVGGHCGTVV